jgi:hypothetical protein
MLLNANICLTMRVEVTFNVVYVCWASPKVEESADGMGWGGVRLGRGGEGGGGVGSFKPLCSKPLGLFGWFNR